MQLHTEIHEQPTTLQHLLGQMPAILALAEQLRQHEIDSVYLAARGTSEHAGIYGQYIFGAYNRLPVALAAPSLFTLYNRPPRLHRSLVIGISQSGQSPDIVGVLETARQQGAPTLAITNAPDSPLARAADTTIDVAAGVEQAVAATKTYSGQLLALAMLSAALSGDATQQAGLHAVPQAVAAALGTEPAVQAAAQHYAQMEQCVVLGRGYQFATAMEWSLKLKELTYVLAERYSTAEFQHGPIALIEPGFPVLATITPDETVPQASALLERLAEQGADVCAITTPEVALPASVRRIDLPVSVAPWLMPIVAIGPAQLFCYHLARFNGHDTTSPRGLSKVTRTR